jgi:hypothetical protein
MEERVPIWDLVKGMLRGSARMASQTLPWLRRCRAGYEFSRYRRAGRLSDAVYALEARAGMVRLNHHGEEDLSFASNSQIEALNGPGSAWQAMRFF